MGDGNEAVREDQRKGNQNVDFDEDKYPEGVDGRLGVKPEPGGYAGRDPETEMPLVPSVPDTHTDAKQHDAKPDQKERSPHE